MKIKIAISGIGNCASSLIQGLHYYRNAETGFVPGLMHTVLGGYKISDIEVVAAFDVDKRKIGKDLSEAIFEKPNNTVIFCPRIPDTGVIVQMGHLLDGVSEHMKDYPEDKTFLVSDSKPVDVVQVLKDSGADLLVNYMPVGSKKATQFYAQACLDAKIGFVNAMPEFICSDEIWAKKFEDAGLPCLGDDIKSQLGATIVHRTLSHTCAIRGVDYTDSYQLNVGGNTDFANMKNQQRLQSKKVSKTESVNSQLREDLSYDNLHVGPADFIPFLKDDKEAFIKIDGKIFGDVPIKIFTWLQVTDSPNSAGVIIDAIRMMKIALDRKVAGPLIECSAFLMKHPLIQMTDDEAFNGVENFIRGYPKWICVFPTRTRDLSESGEYYSEVFTQTYECLEMMAEKRGIVLENNGVSEFYCKKNEYLSKMKDVCSGPENRKENTLFVSFCYLNKMAEMEEILKTWHGKIIAVNAPPPANVTLPVSTYLGPDDVEIGKMLAIEALKTASSRKYILRHKDNYYPFTLREEGIRKLIPEAISISVNNIPEIKESDVVISFGNRATEALIKKNITAKIIAIDGTKKIKKATNVASFDQGISEYLSPLDLGSEKITS